MFGAFATTAMLTVAVTLPPEFVAVTVNGVDDMSSVGVPEMTPFCGLIDIPVGSTGETVHVGKVPVTVGVIGLACAFNVKDRVDGEYEMPGATAAAVTSRVIVAVEVPDELVAVTV
jgi:hypothetical protein